MNVPKDFPLKSEVLAHGEHEGIQWVAARAPLYGAVNGYVRVSRTHPWHGYEYMYEIPNNVPWGEITYGNGNWFGFDTLHAGQHWEGNDLHFGDEELMTEEKVIGYCKQLAHDAASAIYNGTYVI